jgi:5-aminopentanamidase
MLHLIAAYQFCPSFLDPDRNLSRLEQAVERCDGGILVLPELCTTGYFFSSRAELAEFAEPATGRACAFFRETAMRKRAVIVAGFAEADGDRLYNSAITAFPDGSAAIYRKTHLFGFEKDMFTPGDTGFAVHQYHDLRIGIMICYDWRFPESVRTLALRGAQLVCHPSDLVALPRLWKPVMQTRSFENKIYTVTADRNGTETVGDVSLTFHGSSQITDVNGAVLAECGEDDEGWITAEIDPARTVDKSFSSYNDIFGDRRPEMYQL